MSENTATPSRSRTKKAILIIKELAVVTRGDPEDMRESLPKKERGTGWSLDRLDLLLYIHICEYYSQIPQTFLTLRPFIV